jgi:galactose oxidase-like protein/Kelch motif protein
VRALLGLLALAVLVSPSGGAVMTTPRAAHTATLLPTGEVLIAGGCAVNGCDLDERGRTTELFDPRTGRFRTGPALSRPRVGHAAVRLRDGSVLVVGGWSGGPDPTASAELYEPGGVFLGLPSMTTPRGGFSVTLLPDGRVLIAGGTSGDRTLRSAELFDPRTRTFRATGSMRTAREAHAAAVVRGGRVLVSGGAADRRVLASAEIFDPRAGRFVPARPMTLPRYKHAAVALRGGWVLVVGGSNDRDFRGRYRSAELYDPRRARFVRVGQMSQARFKIPDAVVRLSSGKVFVAGGGPAGELYEPGRRRFRPVAGTGATLSFATATVLRDGRVLVAGGYDDRIAITSGARILSPG